jgi:hypothetical protein
MNETTGKIYSPNDTFVFKFDKKRLKHEVLSSLHSYRFCPFLNRQYIEEIFNEIPDEIIVTPKSEWELQTDYDNRIGSLNVVEEIYPDGEDENDDDEKFVYRKEYKISGIREKSKSFSIKLIKNVVEKLKLDKKDFRKIFSYKE